MEYIMGFGSAHKALKAEEILKGASVPFRLMPAPRALDPACGLVIQVGGDILDKAVSALERAGLPPRNIYRREGDDYVKM